MATYSSKPVSVGQPIATLYDKFTDLSRFEDHLQQLPPEQLAKVGDVKFSSDSISINTPQMGEIKFQVIEREQPTKVVLGSPGSPVPLTMSINLKETGPETTEVTTSIDVEIPAMLRPLVGPKLQEAADKFGEMISNLSKVGN